MAKSSTLSTPVGPRSIWSRKLDLFYVFFVSIMLVLAFTLDFVPYYPIALPSWATAFRSYFIAEYNDPLFLRDPPFFQLFTWMEVFLTVPGGAWIVWSLITDDKAAPLYLLIWATHFCSSSLVCLVELLGTKDWPQEDITKNAPGYVIFLAIGVGIMFDTFARIKRVLLAKVKNA